MGQDFGGKDGWSMYHGQVVPGFPKHPHRGFETITICREGFVDHTDSLGCAGRFGEGDVQWMTAGAGVQHAEMFPLLSTEKRNKVELFQIWINLPKAKKMADPFFKMLWVEDLPVLRFDDTVVTLVAGALDGVEPPAPPPASWASQPGSDVAVWNIRMGPGAKWEMPPGPEGVRRTLYHFGRGSAVVSGRSVNGEAAVEVSPTQAVELSADPRHGTEFLLLQGRPIAEPVVQHGPFVMTTRQEIRQAFEDYQRTEFGGWPWPSNALAHKREQGRFAKYSNGRVEMPSGADGAEEES